MQFKYKVWYLFDHWHLGNTPNMVGCDQAVCLLFLFAANHYCPKSVAHVFAIFYLGLKNVLNIEKRYQHVTKWNIENFISNVYACNTNTETKT